jgi:hypothetical protein
VEKVFSVTLTVIVLLSVILFSSAADREGKGDRKQAAGEVVTFDTATKVLVMRDAEGEKRFIVDDKTVVTGAKKALAELRAGDKVFLEIQTVAGRQIVKKIVVKPERTIILKPDTQKQDAQ